MSINAQPFQPQFKLIGNLAEDQVLVYDTSEGAFVNSAGSGGGGASGFTAIENVGTTGTAIHYGEAGTTLQLKKLIGGDNLTITDNGTGGLILAATNTDTIQDGTNLGSGTGLFSSKDSTSHALQFKSLAVGAGLTLTDDGNGTITLVNTIASGTTDADLTLSNLSNVETARTNLDVYSKAEGDTRYHDKFSNFLPSQNNVYDVGSPSFKFNDIYAETFQGTAILAENLAISGTAGQVLTHNGSTWVAGAGSSVLSSASDMSNVAPADGQHLVWDAGTSLWTPSSAGEGMGGGGYGDSNARGAISVSGDLSYNNSTGVISFTQNDAWSNITGTPTTLAGYGITDAATSAQGALADSALQSVPAQTFASLTGKPTTLAGYGITDGGGSYDNSSVDTHLNTGTATANQALVWTGTDYDWVTSTDSDTTYTAGTGLTLTGTEFSLTSGHFDGAFTSLSGVASAGASEDDMVLYYDHSTTSFKWKAGGTPAGYNNTNWDTAFGWGDHSTQGYLTSTTAHYTDSDVNTHLNVSGATANQVLKWTGTDYAWVTSTDSDTTYTAGTGISISGGANAITNTSPDQTVVLTGAGATTVTGTYPSFTITSTDTDTNTTYVSGPGITLDGNEFSLSGLNAVSSDINDWDTAFGWGDHSTAGYLTSETDSQTLSLSGTTLTISTGNNVDLGALTIDDFADVNITSVSDGQFLTYDNGLGEWTNSTVSIPTLTSQLTNDAGFLTSETAHYADSDVDSHLNQSNPTSGYVLSWNGSDYAWVSNGASGAHYTDTDARAAFSATTGLSYNSGTGVFSLNAQLENLSDVSSTAPSTGQVLKWNGSTWTPSADENDDTIYTTFNTDFDTRLSGKSTTNLSEGTNKYFTDTRVRNAISVSGDLTYNASTGVISFTETANYENSDVDTHLNSGSATTGQILSWDGSDYDWIANSGTPAWTAVTGKPTTIAGFGITDAFDGLYSSLSGTPTTIAGYGITDAVTPTSANVFTNKQGNISQWTNDTGYLTSVPAQTFASLTGKPTSIAGYGITDAFDGAFGSLSGKPTTIAGYGITDAVTPSSSTAFTNKSGNISQWTNDSNYLTSVPAQTFASLTGTPTTLAGYGITDGNTYANGDVDTHLNVSGASASEVLSWNGSDYTWVTNTGSGATDKIEEGNSSVEVLDGGANGHIMFTTEGTDRWQVTNGGHILPETTEVYDIGSADKKVRHLFLSDNSLYIDTNTIKTSGTNLLFNDEDVMDYANLKNKPDTSSGGTGIQVNSGVVSLNSALSGLSDVSSTTPNSGEVLKWNGSEWAPGTDLTSGSSAMNDLSDVDTSGISSGQYLKWNGSAFVASTVTAGATSIDALTDVDTTTSAPSNGDVLTWVQADSEWAPQAPSGGGGGGSGASVEYFKLNYASNGNLTSITNATSGVSATILSATGGDVEISFSGASYPPSSILIYGYAYSANQYVIMPLSTDITTRVVDAGGTAGSPTAFGSFSSTDMTLKLRENDTGASRGFGTTTHAWIMFTLA